MEGEALVRASLFLGVNNVRDRGLSEAEGYIINIECKTLSADIRLAVAAAEHQYYMCGCCICIIPLFLNDLDELAFGISGIICVIAVAEFQPFVFGSG